MKKKKKWFQAKTKTTVHTYYNFFNKVRLKILTPSFLGVDTVPKKLFCITICFLSLVAFLLYGRPLTAKNFNQVKNNQSVRLN